MKWIVLAFIIWLAWRIVRHSQRESPSTSSNRDAERMVSCAHCGLNIPLAEALPSQADYFCGAEHKEAAARRQQDPN